MLSNNQEPTFNLKVVVRETGLKPDTLRAWERRYGLPQPKRTAGGHRLYSQHDIDVLKWLVARQKEGLSISRAVDLWRQVEAEGKNPLEATSTSSSPSSSTSSAMGVGQAINELRQAWISACLAFDEQRAEQILTQSFAIYPPEVVCFELLQQAVAEIGEGWYEGEVTVHQEHFSSALATRRLEAMLAATPSPTRPGRIIVGCPSNEDHVFGPLLLTLVLRRQGRDVIYLGANVPTVRLETTIATTNPQLVVLSAQQLPSAASLQEMGHLLQKLQVPMAFGGQVFNLVPGLPQRIPGHFLGQRLDEAPIVIDQLLGMPTPVPLIDRPDGDVQTALAAYRQHQARIEAEIWQSMNGTDMLYQHLNLNFANKSLAHNITAALTLGNMAYIGDSLMWVKGILSNQRLPTELLRYYLNAYRQAVQTHLGSDGKPIIHWFDRIISNNESGQSI